MCLGDHSDKALVDPWERSPAKWGGCLACRPGSPVLSGKERPETASSPRAHLPGDPSTRDKRARRGPPSQKFNKEDLPFSSFPGSSITKATSSPTKSTRDPRIILHTASWKALFPLDMTLWNKPQCQALEVKVQVKTHDPVILVEGQAGPGQSHSHPGRRGPPPKRWIFRNSGHWPGDKVSFKLLCVVRFHFHFTPGYVASLVAPTLLVKAVLMTWFALGRGRCLPESWAQSLVCSVNVWLCVNEAWCSRDIETRMLCFPNLLAGVLDKHGVQALTPEQTTDSQYPPPPSQPEQKACCHRAGGYQART